MFETTIILILNCCYCFRNMKAVAMKGTRDMVKAKPHCQMATHMKVYTKTAKDTELVFTGKMEYLYLIT